MATIYQSKQTQNQGQAFVMGWNNQSTLKNITAYVGTDGNPFLPIDDRNYLLGRIVRATRGSTGEEGFPSVYFAFSEITDGQLDYLRNTLWAGAASAKTTVRYHRFDSVGKLDTFVANCYSNLNLDQLPGLERIKNGYAGYRLQHVIVQTL